ncbi:hypothetical protein AB0L99_19215 [Streptomyces sp. NPDC051954]|uniref:hypothetical protein n=1 Tax=Streptomyces sp. NPDC051954 TaxID=3155524 RepID=UPI0034289164
MDGTRQLSPELTGAFAGDLRFPVGGTVVAFLHRHRGNAIRFWAEGKSVSIDAMMAAELLAESGNTVMFLDADIAHCGGTSARCERAKVELGDVPAFADHVALFSRARTGTRGRRFSERLLDVTPACLRRHDCGRILLLPATRPSDRTFAFEGSVVTFLGCIHQIGGTLSRCRPAARRWCSTAGPNSPTRSRSCPPVRRPRRECSTPSSDPRTSC